MLLAVPFWRVKVVVPDAPDQVTLNGAPAVRSEKEGFVKLRVANVVSIPNAKRRRHAGNMDNRLEDIYMTRPQLTP